MTSVASINPRLISAVSPDPARLLAASAAELADRWDSGVYHFHKPDPVTHVEHVRDAIQSLAEVIEPGYRNLNSYACDRAEGDRRLSRHAAARVKKAHAALIEAARELERTLDRYDHGIA